MAFTPWGQGPEPDPLAIFEQQDLVGQIASVILGCADQANSGYAVKSSEIIWNNQAARAEPLGVAQAADYGPLRSDRLDSPAFNPLVQSAARLGYGICEGVARVIIQGEFNRFTDVVPVVTRTVARHMPAEVSTLLTETNTPFAPPELSYKLDVEAGLFAPLRYGVSEALFSTMPGGHPAWGLRDDLR